MHPSPESLSGTTMAASHLRGAKKLGAPNMCLFKVQVLAFAWNANVCSWFPKSTFVCCSQFPGKEKRSELCDSLVFSNPHLCCQTHHEGVLAARKSICGHASRMMSKQSVPVTISPLKHQTKRNSPNISWGVFLRPFLS